MKVRLSPSRLNAQQTVEYLNAEILYAHHMSGFGDTRDLFIQDSLLQPQTFRFDRHRIVRDGWGKFRSPKYINDVDRNVFGNV